MSTNTTYLITLRPTGNFYFGNEKHFSFGGKNYLVKSNPFPQQTTLLGMLRYELLRNAGLLNGVNKTEERTLIGASGFNPGNGDGYGMIRRLSPVFLYEANKEAAFIPRGFAYQDGDPLYPVTDEAGQNIPAPLPVLLKGYDVKKQLDDTFINPYKGDILPLTQVYRYPTQTGNQKNNKDNDEEALYKQTYCRFAVQDPAGNPVNWCFAFYLDTTQPLPLVNNSIVSMGGDQSAFLLRYREAGNTLFTPALPVPGADRLKITLLSDACSKDDLCAMAIASVAPAADFRYIETTAETKNYYNVSYRSNNTESAGMLRSGRHSLYKAGSVFWISAGDLAAFEKALHQPAFFTIGYNYYQTEKI